MIRQATIDDAAAAAGMAVQLWPEHTVEEMTAEYRQLLQQPDAAIFLATEDGVPSGFAQCQLRHDCVEGASSSPTGYLEGIWVSSDSRGRGVAASLLNACEAWARAQGCREFASDCELDNTASLAFHLRVGFEEASRNIHFIKTL